MTVSVTSEDQKFDFLAARFNMIEQQVRPWRVSEPAVLAALDSVPREQFCPDAYRLLAYADLSVPLAGAGDTTKVMLPPRVQARMVQTLNLTPQDRVLEIGAGTGYTAALMSKLAKHIVGLEMDGALASLAKKLLSEGGFSNVDVRNADASAQAFAACADGGPWDAIVLSGSVAEVPKALLDLLKIGGRLLALVGDDLHAQAQLVVRRTEHGFDTQSPWDAQAPRLQGFPAPSSFEF